MRAFSIKLADGETLIGLMLGDTDLSSIRNGHPISCTLEGTDTGIWMKDQDGQRRFLQPRNSKVILIEGETAEDIGRVFKRHPEEDASS